MESDWLGFVFPTMYTLPRDFDGGFFLGKEIEVVCFALYQVNFTFTGGLWLQIEGSFEHRSASGKVLPNGDGFPLRDTTLVRLVGSSVVKCGTFDDQHLLLELSNGDQLFVSGDNGMYEAYQLFDGEKEIII